MHVSDLYERFNHATVYFDFVLYAYDTSLYSRMNTMTSSNGNIFRVTGHSCVEFISHPGELPTQRPMSRSVDVFFDLRPNKRSSKQSWGWWFETPSRPLWRHCDEIPSKYPININHRLSYVYDWLAENKISLNIKKTVYMIFHALNKNFEGVVTPLQIDHIPMPIERLRNFFFR